MMSENVPGKIDKPAPIDPSTGTHPAPNPPLPPISPTDPNAPGTEIEPTPTTLP